MPLRGRYQRLYSDQQHDPRRHRQHATSLYPQGQQRELALQWRSALVRRSQPELGKVMLSSEGQTFALVAGYRVNCR